MTPIRTTLRHVLLCTLIGASSVYALAKVRAPEVYTVDEPITKEIVITPKEQQAAHKIAQTPKQTPTRTTGQSMNVWGSASSVPTYPAPAVPYTQSEVLSSLPAYTSRLPPGEFGADFWTRPRALYVYNVHTKEKATITYWANGQLIPAGYWELCRLLRDHRENLMAAMDPKLFDMMYGIQGYYHAWKHFEPLMILSGYRTPKTNKMLESEGAGKASQHVLGKAVDIRIPGIAQANVGNLARYFNQGGVGFYYGSNFTHIDTGPVRTWTR